MSRIAILGAGPLGAAIAARLARSGWCGSIVLVDPAAEVAAGKALDIGQAAPVEGHDTRLEATDDITACAMASLVVVADSAGASGGELQGEPALALVARVARMNKSAPVLCAGHAHRWLVERAVFEVPGQPGRVFGTAPHALASAARALLAARLGCSALDVQVPLLGVPPASVVVPWDAARVGDARAGDVCRPEALRQLERSLARTWPLGPYALAAAAGAVALACLTASHRRFTCFTPMDVGEAAGAVGMVSCTLAASGVAARHLPALTATETLAVERALRS